MPYPTDILLPSVYKSFGIVDTNYEFNQNYDIVWSFTYKLSGFEHGICTYLTSTGPLTSFPGQYLSYSGNIDYDNNGVLAIAFDSTGLFALSSTTRPGVGLGSIKPNSLVVRDGNDNVVLYETLSNISPSFSLEDDDFKNIRVIYGRHGNFLSIDYKNEYDNVYLPLTSIEVDLNTDGYGDLSVGFSFNSPISSASETPSILHLKRIHVQGIVEDETYEYVFPTTSLYSVTYQYYNQPDGVSVYYQPDGVSVYSSVYTTTFTKITGVSATPID